jgi:hypothetical protein
MTMAYLTTLMVLIVAVGLAAMALPAARRAKP